MTKAQKKHIQRLLDMGCIICGSPAEIHHCGTHLGGGRDHDKVIPLCDKHHRNGTEHEPSIHPWRDRFEAMYGTEEELMKLCR